jgi:hypothetical protein
MAKPEIPQLVIDDVIWYDGDYALDSNDELFQFFINEHVQYWFFMGSDEHWHLNVGVGPRSPIRKVVFHVLPNKNEKD